MSTLFRNYHVFFYLLASDFVENGSTTNPFAWLKKILHLGSSSEYQYLNKVSILLQEENNLEASHGGTCVQPESRP